MRKKILAYLLLFLFLFNTMGYYFIYEINKSMVKKEMEALIKQMPRQVTRIDVSEATLNADLQRMDKHEIRYKGHLYDVMREEQTGNVTVFYCFPDHKEDNLVSGFEKVNNTRYSLLLHDHLIKIALPLQNLSVPVPVATYFGFKNFNDKLRSWFLNTWTPPPELT